eukprot:186471-Chlamydomonas_euryale.AAC.3
MDPRRRLGRAGVAGGAPAVTGPRVEQLQLRAGASAGQRGTRGDGEERAAGACGERPGGRGVCVCPRVHV